jgi:rSAM/selenodomain-associated transferase 1
MAKAPVAGRAKTRMARDLGVGTAIRFSRHAITAVLARVAPSRAWQTVLAVTPDAATAWRMWPRGVAHMPQGAGDLGARMQRIMRHSPPGPVVIIGTDVPALGCAHVREAFRLLGRHDAVFGPATDGGYWLIGLRRRPRLPNAFHGVRWSTAHALADTAANLNGYSIALLPALSDVDTLADLERCGDTIGRRILPPSSASAASTN